MALINCPECEKEISDRVKACPNCGFPFDSTNELNSSEIPLETTPQAPQQVEVTGVRVSKKSKKYIAISFVLILIAVAAVFIVKFINDQNSKADYQATYNSYVDNLELFRILSLGGGSKAESLCNLTSQVWRNTIYKDRDSKTDKFTRPNGYWVDDFNVALANLFSDSDTKSNVSSIETNRDTIKGLWKDLQDPPEGLEKCYDIANRLYEAYNSLTGLAINPTGNLTSFSTKKQEYVDEYLKYYE